jgi:hypothetical protein
MTTHTLAGRRAGLLLVATLAAAAAPLRPAAAQDRPPMMPSRDVSVTYRVEGGGQSSEMKLSWLNAQQTMRMDLPNGAGWSLTDMKSGRIRMVMDPQRMVMEVPRQAGAAGGPPMQPSPTARFTRGGTESILGQTCTVWRMEDGGTRGEACVTADGVMLRSQGASPDGTTGSMSATAVDFGAQDPARFRVPADYRTMQMPPPPQSGGAAPPPPPARPTR